MRPGRNIALAGDDGATGGRGRATNLRLLGRTWPRTGASSPTSTHGSTSSSSVTSLESYENASDVTGVSKQPVTSLDGQ
jgi:hypothetical protein